eukprot:TRINITY_DN61292_c0_g1_i2.p1 TRINITY_DN61292_c0_g1~~TRINITY_DN61292_c0_g1_i2.p1  ORF type:complete len:252 (-),score=23.09 TRINITY_DN61292_c0_g1_i2:231-956(-)
MEKAQSFNSIPSRINCPLSVEDDHTRKIELPGWFRVQRRRRVFLSGTNFVLAVPTATNDNYYNGPNNHTAVAQALQKRCGSLSSSVSNVFVHTPLSSCCGFSSLVDYGVHHVGSSTRSKSSLEFVSPSLVDKLIHKQVTAMGTTTDAEVQGRMVRSFLFSTLGLGGGGRGVYTSPRFEHDIVVKPTKNNTTVASKLISHHNDATRFYRRSTIFDQQGLLAGANLMTKASTSPSSLCSSCVQ